MRIVFYRTFKRRVPLTLFDLRRHVLFALLIVVAVPLGRWVVLDEALIVNMASYLAAYVTINILAYYFVRVFLSSRFRALKRKDEKALSEETRG